MRAMFQSDEFSQAVTELLELGPDVTEDIGIPAEDIVKFTVVANDRDEWAIVQEQGIKAFQGAQIGIFQYGLWLGLKIAEIRRGE